MPPTLLGWIDYDAYPTPENKGDAAKAKSMLAEAGYPDGIELTLDTRTTARTRPTPNRSSSRWPRPESRST